MTKSKKHIKVMQKKLLEENDDIDLDDLDLEHELYIAS